VAVVQMKPLQIVRGFTYGGTVLDEAPPSVPLSRPPPPLPGLFRRETGWSQLRSVAAAQQSLLSAPQAGCALLCTVCRGPAGKGSARCFPCDLHLQCAPGALADLVVPVAFAIKGGPHARRLWQYKSPRLTATAAAGPGLLLRSLLLVFLRDHARCLWRAAGMPGPTHVAVVPTARGRPGPHPLRTLVQGYLATPWAAMVARPGGEQVRDLDPERFTAQALPGARVLLIDDTWATGSSAQSAAMALRQAGARSVVTVVLGRHMDSTAADQAGLGPARMPFLPGCCAVHEARAAGSRP
jgi:hypothetical protein